jgi:hypothetical protein
MRRHFIFVICLALIPLSLMAQQVNWEAMERPCFVKDASGVAVGWEEGTQYSYMMASDLIDRWAYATTIEGAEDWSDPELRQIIVGVTQVSASCNNGRTAIAIPCCHEQPKHHADIRGRR